MEDIMEKEIIKEMRKSLSKLSQKQRIVFVLFYAEEQSILNQETLNKAKECCEMNKKGIKIKLNRFAKLAFTKEEQKILLICCI